MSHHPGMDGNPSPAPMYVAGGAQPTDGISVTRELIAHQIEILQHHIDHYYEENSPPQPGDDPSRVAVWTAHKENSISQYRLQIAQLKIDLANVK